MTEGQLLLCDDVMENIFRFLSPTELLQTRQVCKKWKTIIHDTATIEISCLNRDMEKFKTIFPKSNTKPIFTKRQEIISPDGDEVVEFTHCYEDGQIVTSSKFPGVTRHYHDDYDQLVYIEEIYYYDQENVSKIVDILYDSSNNEEPVRIRTFQY